MQPCVCERVSIHVCHCMISQCTLVLSLGPTRKDRYCITGNFLPGEMFVFFAPCFVGNNLFTECFCNAKVAGPVGSCMFSIHTSQSGYTSLHNIMFSLLFNVAC